MMNLFKGLFAIKESTTLTDSITIQPLTQFTILVYVSTFKHGSKE